MLETVYVFLAATLFGVAAGLIPGISVFVTLLIAYPWLVVMSPVDIIMFYVVVVSLSQYFGSVSATIFSIPGTTSSIPSVYEGHTLFKNGQGDQAIMFAAVGSFFGSVFAVGITLLLLNHLFYFFTMFDSRVRGILLLFAIGIFVFTGKNKLIINLLMVAIGFLLAYVGYDPATNSSFMTFGISYLYSGIPLIAVMLGIYVIPFIINSIEEKNQTIDFNKLKLSGYINTLKNLVPYKGVLLRSSIFGYVSGFIPGITYQLGTTLAYYYEKTYRKKDNKYKQGDLNCLLAAETANNAGVFSQILPLLMIGIPITGSQALIYDIFSNAGALLTVDFFNGMFEQITIAYIISSIIGIYLAGKYVNWLSWIFRINFNYIYCVVICLLLLIAFYSGAVIYQGLFYLTVTLVLCIFGFIVRKYDTLPLIFSFLLFDPSYAIVNTLLGLYF